MDWVGEVEWDVLLVTSSDAAIRYRARSPSDSTQLLEQARVERVSVVDEILEMFEGDNGIVESITAKVEQVVKMQARILVCSWS